MSIYKINTTENRSTRNFIMKEAKKRIKNYARNRYHQESRKKAKYFYENNNEKL